MRKLLQRCKQLRLRWKLIPLVLLAGLVGFIWWARLPWYEIRMTEVVPYEGHPDWLEVRFEVENLRGREFEIMVEGSSRLVAVSLQESFIPLHVETYQLDLSNSPFRAASFSSVTVKLENFGRENVIKGRSIIHQEVADSEMLATCFDLAPLDLIHSSMKKWLHNLDTSQSWSSLGVEHSIRRKLCRSVEKLFFPQLPTTKPFTPSHELSGPAYSLFSDTEIFVKMNMKSDSIFTQNDSWEAMRVFVESEGEEMPLATLGNGVKEELVTEMQFSESEGKRGTIKMFLELCDRYETAQFFREKHKQASTSKYLLRHSY